MTFTPPDNSTAIRRREKTLPRPGRGAGRRHEAFNPLCSTPRAPNKGRGLLRQGFGAAQRPKGAYRIAGQPRGRCPRSYGSASSTRCETAAGSILPLLGVQILLCSRGASPGEKSGRKGGSVGTPGSGNRARPPGSGVAVDGTGRWHLGGCSASLVFDGISSTCPRGKKKSLGLGAGGSTLPGPGHIVGGHPGGDGRRGTATRDTWLLPLSPLCALWDPAPLNQGKEKPPNTASSREQPDRDRVGQLGGPKWEAAARSRAAGAALRNAGARSLWTAWPGPRAPPSAVGKEHPAAVNSCSS